MNITIIVTEIHEKVTLNRLRKCSADGQDLHVRSGTCCCQGAMVLSNLQHKSQISKRPFPSNNTSIGSVLDAADLLSGRI